MTEQDDAKIEEMKAQYEAELTPALEAFAPVAREAIAKLAATDGWSEEQAAWLAERALPAMLVDLAAEVDPQQAFANGYRTARQAYSLEVFEHALAGGKGHDVAFLSLVELEGMLSDRLGEPRTAYSDALLEAGCAAVRASAAEGLSPADQIGNGFAMMDRLREEFGEPASLPDPQ